MLRNELFRDTVGWGIGLWPIGYVLGLVLFAVLPTSVIGYAIMPIGLTLTVWVLLTRVSATSMRPYMLMSVVWTLIMIVFDYLFLVRVFTPSDGYYKLDAYLYYSLTFLLPSRPA